MEYDLTTFATEGMENDERADAVVSDCAARGWLQSFPTGFYKRDISIVIGRDAFEALVLHDRRAQVLDAFKAIHYTVLEGE